MFRKPGADSSTLWPGNRWITPFQPRPDGRFTTWVRCCLLLLVVLLSGKPWSTASAEEEVPTPYDLIAAVNALRANEGLPPLVVDGKLMYIAQAHADYQASIGQWTHTGPGGTRPIDRAYAAGYGDGGQIIISENIAVQYGEIDLNELLYDSWADQLHWNTMTKPDYKHIGAGIAQVGQVTYFTIDTGWVVAGTANYTPQPSSDGSDSEGTSDGDEASWITEYMLPVVTVTPMDDGKIIHTVQFGQTLWSIATAYEMKVEDLASLNSISLNDPTIYEGQKLYIAQATEQPAAQQTSLVSNNPTRTPSTATKTRRTNPTQASTALQTRAKPTSTQQVPPSDQSTNLSLIIVIVIAAGVLGIMLIGFIKPRQNPEG